MRLFTLLVFLFSIHQSGAQVKTSITVSGRITDAVSGQPLSGASVYFSDARIGAIADSNGRYLLRNVPPGHHLVEISYAGFHSLVKHMDLAVSGEFDFSLEPAIVENQGVTVTGVTSATSTRHTTVPVTIMRKNDLIHNPSSGIVDVLAMQPGISQISTGAAISKPVIRGLSANRVVVVHDGLRQEGQQWGEEHGIEIDEYSVQRAEIIKGPSSILYGSDALGGVIHLLSNIPVGEGTIKGNVFTGYQSNNGQWGLNANVSGNLNGWNWNAYGSTRSAKDYRNKFDGRVLNSRFNELNFGGYFGLNKSWGFSHLIFSAFGQEVGLVEGERDPLSGAFLLYPGSSLERIAGPEDLDGREVLIPSQNIQHYRLISDNNFIAGNNRLRLNLGFQNNIRKEFGNPEDEKEAELFFDLKTFNYNLQWRLPERNEWETTAGLSGMWQQNRNRGEETIIPAYRLNDAGLFFFAQKKWNTLGFTSGIRYDHRKIETESLTENGEQKFLSFTESFSNVSGTAGVSYHPADKFVFRFNLAKGFRSPSLPELASNGAHEGTIRYEYGNQNLKSEKSWQADAGVDVDYEHISFSINGFYNRIRDYIFYNRLQNEAGADSVVDVDGETFDAFQFSQDHATLRGIEITADLHPHPLDWLHFENSFSFVNGRFDHRIDGSDNLPLIPSPRWISELRMDFRRSNKAIRHLYFHMEMEKTFKQDQPFFGYNTETPTAGYTLLHTGAGADFFSKTRMIFQLHLAVRNLTDEAYQSHLSRLKYTALNEATGRRGVFNMGRNFSVRLNVPFVWK